MNNKNDDEADNNDDDVDDDDVDNEDDDVVIVNPNTALPILLPLLVESKKIDETAIQATSNCCNVRFSIIMSLTVLLYSCRVIYCWKNGKVQKLICFVILSSIFDCRFLFLFSFYA